jgi:hypothetical protein
VAETRDDVARRVAVVLKIFFVLLMKTV